MFSSVRNDFLEKTGSVAAASTVDYLIMYEVVVYISHTVWTSESSHDGMQGNIQFIDKCIMYWLNGQNIHYEIVFSQQTLGWECIRVRLK